MNSASATLNLIWCSRYPSGRRASVSSSSECSPSVSFTRNPRRSLPRAPKTRSARLVIKPIRISYSSLSAIADDTTALQNDFVILQDDFAKSSTIPLERPDDNGESRYNEDKLEGLSDGKTIKMIKICDRLIEVFMVDKPTPTDWRRLLAFSKEWSNIRPHFFKRCLDRAINEDDPGMKHKLHKLGRKLKEIDEDVERHNELLNVVRGAPSEIPKIVAKRRKDFTKDFFVHLHTVAQSYHNNQGEQSAVAKLGNLTLAAVQAYDTAFENMESLNTAELKLQDIINSPSVDAACRKIDSLAERNQLDSALVLMITKAWSAAKESNMTKNEVKDVLYHLYVTARGNLQRQMPKEIRILKHLLMIQDPEELQYALKDAFTPGEEIEGKDIDSLYTSPEVLHTWMRTVVDAYHFSKEGTLVRQARDLMNPKVIQKIEELIRLVEKGFL